MHPSSQHQTPVDQAAAVLRAGGVAILPSETIYGAYAIATGSGLVALKAIEHVPHVKPRAYPWTWHAPSRQRLEEVLPVHSPLHQRVLRVLMPGPIRVQMELDDAQINSALTSLNLAPGVIDGVFPDVPGRVISARVPEHAATSRVLAEAGGVCVAEAASNLGLGDGVSLPKDAPERAAALGITSVIDDGPTRYGLPSTVIRLLAGGGYRIGAVGAIDEREIRRRIERRILFVCSGNTCRSPVAEAIARSLLAARTLPPGQAPVPTSVLSAGTSAAGGLGMTPESARAVGEMGIEPGPHTSRALTRDMLIASDRVFVMTRQHRRTVEMMGVPIGVELLDPGGDDIDDPIGAPLNQYREMAKRVHRAVEQRLNEIEQGDHP